MPDEARILLAAEAERDHADLLLVTHIRDCKAQPCGDCRSLADHAARTQRQVELLLAADAGMDVMFGD